MVASACGAAGSATSSPDQDVGVEDASVEDGSVVEDADLDVVEEAGVATYRFLLKTLTLPWEESPGVVVGFDLDGRVSDGSHPDDCSWEDFTSPAGAAGVDNQMARLTPLFEPAGLGQAFEYLENSIEDSGFFHLFELQDVDSLVDDDHVVLIYELGGGSGLMDPQGDLVAYQTMCVQNDSPHVVATEASIVDGVLHARFDALTFTFSMFERTYPFDFLDLQFEARLTDEGFLVDGVIGGSLAMSNIMDLVIKGAQNTGGLLEPMQLLLDGLGDMSSEGTPCGALSTALELSAVPVFFYPADSDCDPCGNDICEYFESCETCLIDCCSGCGNGQCDEYPVQTHEVTVTTEGFQPIDLDTLVGDSVVWTNQTGGPINLICDGALVNESLEPSQAFLRVATTSGTHGCRVHEQPGQLQTLHIDDNHSETCQSCPTDCGDCE
jgi:hypothetical protein